MIRSNRKNNYSGITTARSEKEDKRIYNRTLRSRVRQILNSCDDFDDVILPEVRDVSDPWSMAKDGKPYSKWMAGYRRTFAKVTRTREGRTRTFLVVTAATFEHKLAERRRRRLSGLFGFRLAEYEREDVNYRDIAHAVECIRK